MIRYDFDVVSDPLPAKPIVPPAAEAQAVRERRNGTSKSAPGKAGEAGPLRMSRLADSRLGRADAEP